jgi:hypothetical protein
VHLCLGFRVLGFRWFAGGVHFFMEFYVHLRLGFRVLGFRWFAGGVHFYLAKVIY